MCSGWVIGSCVTKAQGWARGLLYFVTEAELACFDDFCRHLLTNPVRYTTDFFIIICPIKSPQCTDFGDNGKEDLSYL